MKRVAYVSILLSIFLLPACAVHTVKENKSTNTPVLKSIDSKQPIKIPLEYIVIQRSNDGTQIGFKNDSKDRLFTESTFAIVSDISNLSWIAIRGGSGFDFSVQKKDANQIPIVLESNSIKTQNESMWINSNIKSGNNWIRLYYQQGEATNGNSLYKDVIMFLDPNNSKDAILGLQSIKDNKWEIVDLPNYGDWLMIEINMFIRLTTGL
jgi:hypothetical protein